MANRDWRKCFSAASAPTSTCDAAHNYEVGDCWVDTSDGNRKYTCKVNTNSGAIWEVEQSTPPSASITVGSGKDHATIAEAWNALKGRPITTATTIALDAGTYTESIILSGQAYADMISIVGDTRTAAGQHYATTGNITKSGDNCTITLTSTPPSDFTNADYICVGGFTTADNAGRFPIVSIDTGAKTVTYPNAAGVAEAVLGQSRVVFCPNRILDFTSTGLLYGFSARTSLAVNLQGFTILSTTSSANGIVAEYAGKINCSQIAVYGLNYAFYTSGTGGTIYCDSKCSSVKNARGFYCANGSISADSTLATSGTYGYRVGAGPGRISAASAIVTKMTSSGFSVDYSGYLNANLGVASYCSAGYLATRNAAINATSATAQNCTTGYRAEYGAAILATSTSTNNNGNTGDYSPAVSATAATDGAVIQFS